MNEKGFVTDTFKVPEKVNYNTLLKSCAISCLTAVYDSNYFGKSEMPNYPKREDFGLWLQLLKQVPYAYGYSEPLAYYRIHKNSASRKKFKIAGHQWEVYRQFEKLPLLKSIYYFTCYTILSLIKYRPNF